MSDSDSDASTTKQPTDPKIEQCLRGVVSRLFELDNGEQLTVKNARAAAEEELRLSADFFKSDARWRDRSKTLIVEAATKLQEGSDAPDAREPVSKPAASQTNGAPKPRRGTKRASTDGDDDGDAAPAPQQRSKKRRVAGAGDSDNQDAYESSSPRGRKPQHGHRAKSDPPEKSDKIGAAGGKDDDGDDDDDDLSSLSDVRDSPPPAARRKKKQPKQKRKASADDEDPASDEQPSKPKPKPKPKARHSSASGTAAAAADVPPEEAELKRLQSWLLKCGIRKLWHRELAPFPTHKAKAAHLRAMLSDVGMEGRYSEEKARQIKERRELAADLEAVQEGNKLWGQEGVGDGSDDEEGTAARPKRRLAKGLRDISAFISDGEETD